MKTASRFFLTFTIIAFFASVAFSQTASTANPAKTNAKSATAAPAKANDVNKTATCASPDAKAACAQGKNFVDKNGDGKCDNCGGSGKCTGTGNCAGKGQGCGTSCSKAKGAGNCCGQSQKTGCGSNGTSSPAAQPKK